MKAILDSPPYSGITDFGQDVIRGIGGRLLRLPWRLQSWIHGPKQSSAVVLSSCLSLHFLEGLGVYLKCLHPDVYWPIHQGVGLEYSYSEYTAPQLAPLSRRDQMKVHHSVSLWNSRRDAIICLILSLQCPRDSVRPLAGWRSVNGIMSIPKSTKNSHN